MTTRTDKAPTQSYVGSLRAVEALDAFADDMPEPWRSAALRLLDEEYDRQRTETPEPHVTQRDWQRIAEALILTLDSGEKLAEIRTRFGLEATPTESNGKK